VVLFVQVLPANVQFHNLLKELHTILSNTETVFRIDNCKVGELFFSANNFIILLLPFSVEIFKMINSRVAGRFCIIVRRETWKPQQVLNYSKTTRLPKASDAQNIRR